MKSFACVLMGIAMIAVVVPVTPVEYMFAAPATLENHWCEEIIPTHSRIPETLDCDRSKGRCPSSVVVYYILGECKKNTAEAGSDCDYWQEISYQNYDVKFVDAGHNAQWWGVNGGGLVACTVLSIWVGLGPGGVIGAFVTSIVCGLTVITISSEVNPCDAGSCETDYTKQGVTGPRRTACATVFPY